MNSFKRFAKKFLVWFVTVVMLAAMAPTAVFAAAEDNGTVNPETEIVQDAADNAERTDEQEQTDSSDILDPKEKEENIPAEREPEGKTEDDSVYRGTHFSADEIQVEEIPETDPAEDEIITAQPKVETVSQEAKNAVSYPTLTTGREKKVVSDEETAVYTYKPSATAEYVITSFNQGEYDPYVEIYEDSELTESVDSDDDSGGDGNFKLKVELTANTTYYFVFSAYECEAFSYSVLLRKVEETTVTFYTGKKTDEAWFYGDDFITKRNYAKETYEVGESILDDSLVPGWDEPLLFLGWSVNPDATEPDEDIIASAGLKVYAVWKNGAALEINASAALTDEDGSTFYGFESQSLASGQRYEVTVQLQDGETEMEAKLYRYYFASQEYHWALVGSYSGQGSTIKWILPGLLSGEDYYLAFKSGESAAVLNGTVLLKKVTTANVTFKVNNSNAYYVTWQDGEEIHETQRIETLTEGTVIQDSASGTSICVPTAPGNLRFLGWASSRTATVPDSEIILGTTNKTVYGVWKTIEEHTHTPGEEVRENEVDATCTEDGHYDRVVKCSVCGETYSRETITIPAGHTAGEAVRENEVAATCKKAGSYDEVVYCTVCEEEISRTPKTIETLEHTPADPVRENEVAATCAEEGSYDEVVYCTVCEEEISRTPKTIEKLAHTPGEAVRENEVAATCKDAGSYDEVVYCTVCEEEVSRETKPIPKTTIHTPGEAVRENEVAATCKEAGSYDEVVYCTVCEEELSRTPKTTPKSTTHTPGEAVRENEVAATCKDAGSYDEVIYCTVCEAELSRTPKTIGKLAHTPGEAVRENEVAATCKEAGSYDEVVYCTVCEAELSRTAKTIPKSTIHTPGEAVRENEVPATCTEPGKYDSVVRCTVCSEILSSEEKTIAALGHDWDDGVVTTPATCTEAGEKTFTCKNNKNHTRTEVIPATGHSEAAAVNENIVSATCTKAGSYDVVVRCAVCKTVISKETKVIPATGHSESAAVSENVVPATCEEDGSYDIVVRCAVCQEILSSVHKTVPAFGHDWNEGEVTTPATCEVAGEKTFTCKHDKTHTRTEPVAAIGHDWDEGEITTPATCEAAGEKTFTCKHDKTHTRTEPVAAIGHDWDEGVVTTPATCEKAGVKTFTCKNDKTHTKTTAIPATGHVPGETVIENSESTCMKEGSYDEVVYCTSCGKELSRESHTTGKIPHSPAAEIRESEVPATCTTDGSYVSVIKCSVCGTELSREEKTIPAFGHDWNEGEITTPATCEKAGVKTFTCKNDKKHTKTEVIPSLGHDWDEGAVTTLATCEEAGEKTFTCKNDKNHTKTEVIPALGHDWDEGVITTPATCEEAGVRTFTCKNDKSHTKTEPIPANGHVPAVAASENYVAATCTEPGSYDLVVRCTVCHEVISTEHVSIPVAGHKEGAEARENEVAATCTDDGSYDLVKRCTVCKEVLSQKTIKIPAAGHREGMPERENEVAETCETDGGYDVVVRCTVCKGEISREHEIIPKTGHDWDEGVETTLATCEEAGVKTFTCRNNALHQRTETIPALGHQWGEWMVRKEATETEDGLEARVCSYDPSHEQTRVIPKQTHEHKLEKAEARTATLENTGIKEHWRCTECGLLFADEAGTKQVTEEDITIPKLINVEEAMITVSEAVYTGKEVTPDVTVTLLGKTLLNPSDYTLTYSDNINAGKGKITVSGTGIYGGIKDVEFIIKKAYSTISLKQKTAVYNGSDIFVDPATVKGSSGAVTYTYYQDSNYSKVAESHKAVGTYYVKAKLAADDNCEAASAAVSLIIRKAPSSLTLNDKTVPYNGSPASIDPAKTEGSTGKVTYTYYKDKLRTKVADNTTNAGTYYVKATLAADENYEAAVAEAVLTIEKAPTTVRLNGKTVVYNGKPVRINPAVVKGSSGKITYTYYSDAACRKVIAVPKNAGVYYAKATVAADANYKGASAVAKLTITPVTAKIKVTPLKTTAAKLKKKAQVLSGAIRISSPPGKATYTRVKKGSSKNLLINSKTGKITVKKGTKKGKYSIIVNVKVPKSPNSKALVKKVKVTVNVK